MKNLTKVSLGKTKEPLQSRKIKRLVLQRARCPGVVLFWRKKSSRLELRYRDDGGTAVPRAKILANIAAEDMVSHRLAQLFRNGSSQFDGQVGNAFASIHDIGFGKGLRRAGVQATPAASA